MDRIGYTGLYGKVFRMDYKMAFLQILLTFLGPIKAYGFYHKDIISDTIHTITLFLNCHWKYGIASIAIVLTSYFSTVLHLILFMNEKPLTASTYPYRHAKNLLCYIKRCWNAIRNGKVLPEESKEKKVFAHHVSFNEAMSESVFQLCLSTIIMREFGISSDSTTKWIQLYSIFTSLLSITFEFSTVRPWISNYIIVRMYVYYQTYNILSARAFSEERLLICVLLLSYSAILQSWSFSSLGLLVWPLPVSL